MTVRPIIFSAPMVRSLLEGRKTQTRRILKPDDRGEYPVYFDNIRVGTLYPSPDQNCTRYTPGDLLYVRENFAIDGCGRRVKTKDYTGDAFKLQRFKERLQYAATDKAPATDEKGNPYWWNLRPSIHMPRWASRITLEVTGVKVERLQDISDDDVLAEGLESWGGGESDNEGVWHRLVHSASDPSVGMIAPEAFRELWDSLNAKRGFGWDVNPWLVAVSFLVHKSNVDQMEKTP